MIQLPRRSVTRFFIPLIDVLTLLFCIFLLMPVIQRPEDVAAGGEGTDPFGGGSLSAAERGELERLRKERRAWQDLEKLRQERDALRRLIELYRKEKLDTLQQRLAIRVLEIGEQGKLFAYDPGRAKDRRVEITAATVRDFIDRQRDEAGAQDLYFLILYPRPEAGLPAYPLRSQRELYDRWFEGVPHGYDIPTRAG